MNPEEAPTGPAPLPGAAAPAPAPGVGAAPDPVAPAAPAAPNAPPVSGAASGTDPGESLVTLLGELHDLREPPAVSLWPATPAWALLGGIALLAVALGLRLWLRHRRAHAYRRAALAELQGLEPDLAANKACALAGLDRLLRRTALAAFPRADVAALSGPGWAAFLARTGGEALAPHVPAMAAAAFSPLAPPFDGPGVARAARGWIRHHHA